MAFAVTPACQRRKSTHRAFSPLQIKIDQYFVHNQGQGFGTGRVILTQGQICLLLRATAQ